MRHNLTFALATGMLAIFLPATLMAATFETKQGGQAVKNFGVTVTKSCKIVVVESCTPAKSKLGTLSLKKTEATMTSVNSTTKAHCIDAATGAFKDGGKYVASEVVFTSNGKLGYEQVTAACKKSDGSSSSPVFTISVEK